MLAGGFCALNYIPAMTGASKGKPESIIQKKIGGTSILNVLYSFAKKDKHSCSRIFNRLF